MTQTAFPSSPAESLDRAAQALRAAEREAHAAIDQAVTGLTTAYNDSRPVLRRVGERARDLAQDSAEALRDTAAGMRDRSLRAVDSTRGYVRDEPLKSLLVAAAVGAVVIALVETVRLRRQR